MTSFCSLYLILKHQIQLSDWIVPRAFGKWYKIYLKKVHFAVDGNEITAAPGTQMKWTTCAAVYLFVARTQVTNITFVSSEWRLNLSSFGTHCVELILSISSLNFIHFIAVWMMFRAQLSCVMHQWRCFTYYLFVISEQREIFKFLLVICLSLNYYESLERYTIYYDFSFIACCAPCLACLSYNKSSASAFWSNAFFFFFYYQLNQYRLAKKFDFQRLNNAFLSEKCK